MMKFGYFYTDDGLVIYDVATEIRHGRPMIVAALSSAPSVAFAAFTEAEAVERLKSFLHHRAYYNHQYLSA